MFIVEDYIYSFSSLTNQVLYINGLDTKYFITWRNTTDKFKKFYVLTLNC